MMYTEPQDQHSGWASLSERYEVIREVGDGSFGSVALARVRAAGSHIARRNTMVSPPSHLTHAVLRPGRLPSKL